MPLADVDVKSMMAHSKSPRQLEYESESTSPVFTTEDVGTTAMPPDEAPQNQICSMHPMQTATCFCTVCKIYMCKVCVIEICNGKGNYQHVNHYDSLMPIEKEHLEIFSTCEQTLEITEQTIADLQHRLEEVTTCKDKLDDARDEVVTMIRDRETFLHRMIVTLSDQSRKEVIELCKCESKKLASKHKDTQAYLEQVQTQYRHAKVNVSLENIMTSPNRDPLNCLMSKLVDVARLCTAQPIQCPELVLNRRYKSYDREQVMKHLKSVFGEVEVKEKHGQEFHPKASIQPGAFRHGRKGRKKDFMINQNTKKTLIDMETDHKKHVLVSSNIMNIQAEEMQKYHPWPNEIELKGLAFGPDNDMYCLDGKAKAVQIWKFNDHQYKQGPSFGRNIQQELVEPMGIAVTANGDILITEGKAGHCVKIFDSSGRFVEKFGDVGKNKLQSATGIAVSELGEIIVTDTDAKKVVVFAAGQQTVTLHRFIHKQTKEYEAEFGNPQYIACNKQEDIIISDSEKGCIKIFRCDGRFWFIYGSARHSPDDKLLESPGGVCTDKDGNIFVLDVHTRTVHVLRAAEQQVIGYISLDEVIGDFDPAPSILAISQTGQLVLANTKGMISFVEYSIWAK